MIVQRLRRDPRSAAGLAGLARGGRRRPLRAVIKFIVLGLVLALTWLRLGAPDVALAEAAVGSGLTGALLLVALRRWRGGASSASGSLHGKIDP